MGVVKKWLLWGAAASLGGLVLLLATVGAVQHTFEDAVTGIAGGVTLAAGQQAAAGTNRTGSATYVGVDDSDTFLSQQVLAQTRRWSDAYPPFDNGYGGLCELWVYDVYTAAGLECWGQCCAYRHGQLTANHDGAIPKGAIIFSGIIPSTGRLYENGHRESAFCHTCGHWAGHTAIYIGDGMVAGSQVPYLYSLDAWIEVYGYGGWSTH